MFVLAIDISWAELPLQAFSATSCIVDSARILLKIAGPYSGPPQNVSRYYILKNLKLIPCACAILPHAIVILSYRNSPLQKSSKLYCTVTQTYKEIS
jgi:hypothetical protein